MIMTVYKVETWEVRKLTPEQARAVGELVATIWPREGVTVEMRIDQQLAFGRSFDGPESQAPKSYVVLDGPRLIAHALIFLRQMGTSEGTWPMAALARVCSLPEYRGQGLGALVVRAAFEPVDAGVFRGSLFQTTSDVRPFYEKLGAATIDNRIVNSFADDPEANPFWSPEIMRYPAHAHWPAGTIDLRGPGY
jgi:hypothetical protein